jgi:hypothetical protein
MLIASPNTFMCHFICLIFDLGCTPILKKSILDNDFKKLLLR